MSSVAVHHVVTGRSDGPAVVFSNSLGSTHRMWDPQLAAFEERFRVVRYDTRGHGQSRSPKVLTPSTISPTTSSHFWTPSESSAPTWSVCRWAA